MPGGVAPKFGSEKVSRYTGVSQLQLRVSRYTVQLSLKLFYSDHARWIRNSNFQFARVLLSLLHQQTFRFAKAFAANLDRGECSSDCSNVNRKKWSIWLQTCPNFARPGLRWSKGWWYPPKGFISGCVVPVRLVLTPVWGCEFGCLICVILTYPLHTKRLPN